MRRRLAVAYDVDSSSPMEISGAVGDGCDLVWVVDSSQPLGAMARMLPRLGTVVDRAGLAADAAIAAVAQARPDGIVAFTDSQLATASAIATELGLPGNPSAVTQRFLDKFDQRAALRDAGLPVPDFVSIPGEADATRIAELTAAVSYPAVLKPRRGYGSRETYHVESAGRLLELLAPPAGERVVPREEYVLEEYMPEAGSTETHGFGDYVSVESVVTAGRARHLAVTGKFPLERPYRETGNFMPSSLAPETEAEVLALAGRAVAALGVECGCLHTEIKLTPAGPRVIESNARVGGGGIEAIFGMTYGHSLLRIAALTALGLDLPERMPRVTEDVSYFLVVQPPLDARRLTRMDGLYEVGDVPGVEQVSPNRQVGDEIDWRRGSQGYVVSVLGSVRDHDALRDARAGIHDRLVLEYSR